MSRLEEDSNDRNIYIKYRTFRMLKLDNIIYEKSSMSNRVSDKEVDGAIRCEVGLHRASFNLIEWRDEEFNGMSQNISSFTQDMATEEHSQCPYLWYSDLIVIASKCNF